MTMKLNILITIFLIQICSFYSGSAHTLEIKGIDIPQQVTQGPSQQVLVLNGAGTRTKFIFDIYVGALYLGNPSKDSMQILNDQNSKRISMTFLYDKVEKEKLTNGWTEAFANNLTKAAFNNLKPRIDEFNAAFADTVKDDVIIIDLISNKETIVNINNSEKARVSGPEFQRAVLSIWLGESPADEDLKQAMLGIKDE